MTRIQPVTNPSGKAEELLQMVQKKMGRVPNMMKTLAHAPAALELYLSMSGVLGTSTINVKDRERLALLAAKVNSCDYCDKAHTAIGKSVGLKEDEINQARSGKAESPKTEALLALSSAIITKKGFVSDDELTAARSAGVSDGEILEVVAITCFNIYTNYVNHIAEPTIDF